MVPSYPYKMQNIGGTWQRTVTHVIKWMKRPKLAQWTEPNIDRTDSHATLLFSLRNEGKWNKYYCRVQAEILGSRVRKSPWRLQSGQGICSEPNICHACKKGWTHNFVGPLRKILWLFRKITCCEDLNDPIRHIF